MQLFQIYERPLGYQQITNLSAAVGLTIPPGTKLILVQAEGQPVRWRDDGVLPTAAIGYPLTVGSELRYTGWGKAHPNLKVIEQVSGAKLNVLYYGIGEQ